MLLVSVSQIMGQKQANIWYFGMEAGIDFNSGTPVALTDGKIRTQEGCASVADEDGALLFYTDGSVVYNKNHALMSNGSGLMGNNSSSQSAVVVPLPGSLSKYYIFTVDAVGRANGMRYSVVDISQDGGLGAVITKNVSVLTPASEKITICKHKNNTDYWVITHKFNTNQMHAYLLTAGGLNMTPVISSIGAVIGGSTGVSQGYLKVSPDGSTLAMACDFCGYLQIMKFENSSGVIHSYLRIDYVRPYGVEFSPNNRYLYVTGWGNQGFILQLDLQNYTNPAVKASEVILGTGATPYSFCALQLGPDGKIYVATNREYLHAITEPNKAGTACNYKTQHVDLKGKVCALGLPTYIQSLFNMPLVEVENLCYGDSSKFTLSNNKLDSVFWNFGDPATGAANSSRKDAPAHRFSDSGLYTVRTIVHSGAITDTIITSVRIQRPQFTLGPDTMLCPGAEHMLTVKKPGYSILWQDNSRLNNFTVNQKGYYWAEASSGDCVFRDTINIGYLILPKLDLGKDSFVCSNRPLLLNADIGSATYKWQDGSTGRTFMATAAGKHKVEINYKGCLMADSVNIDFHLAPVARLGNDTTLCQESPFLLYAPVSNTMTNVWQDQSTGSTMLVNTGGLYWLELELNGCSSRDSIVVSMAKTPEIDLGGPQTYCDGDSLIIDLGSAAESYFWQDGSISPRIILKDSSFIRVTARTGLCSSSDSAFIQFIDCNCFVYVPSAFTPQGDLLNDRFNPAVQCPNTEYLLQVVNRWGEIVFESNDPLLGWDGTYNGSSVPQDVYAWSLQFRTFSDKSLKQYRGTLQVLK